MHSDVIGLFGKHLLLKKLAAGGMAEVFLARPASTDANGRVLVIKRILPHIADDQSFLSMFKSEIRICMGLNHPNIVQIHDFGEHKGQPFIAMEFVLGKSLKQVINKFTQAGEPVPLGLAISLASQAAAGLHYAHTFQNTVTGEDLQVVHRDISPHNLLVTYDGNVKIIDFGIAKAATEARERTQTGTFKGKTCYVSPEQTAGDVLDARSDIFSLGIVLWELLTGTRLFKGETDLTILKRIQDCDSFIQPPSSVNPSIPTAVDAIVMKALARNREDRYASAADFQKALRTFLMSFMPGYSYSDVSLAIQQRFADEIVDERKQLRELNEKAQTTLDEANAGVTKPISVSFVSTASGGQPPLSQDTWTQSGPIHFTQTHSTPIFLKKYGNKKVSWRHMVLLAIYVLTIVGIKLDEKYFFFDRFMLPTEVVRNATAAARNAHRATASQVHTQNGSHKTD